MALTKIDSPDLITISNNPIVVVYDSDNKTETDFRYEISVDNSAGSSLVAVKVWPDSTESNYGVFDMSQILKNYINTDSGKFNISDVTFSTNKSVYEYGWTITEYIGSDSGVTTSVDDKFVIRGAFNYDETFDYNNYIIKSGENGLFLSKWSGRRYYGLTDYGILSLFNGEYTSDPNAPTWSRLYIKVYDTSASSIVYYITGEDDPFELWRIPVGPKNLNDAVSNSNVRVFIGGAIETNDIIDTDTDYYEIFMGGATTTPYSETLTIKVKQGCNKYDGTEFMWLGKLGNYETFTFDFANLKSFDIKREEIKKDYRQTIYINTTERHTAISGWLDDTLSSNLIELYNSSDVYVIVDDNILPVIITNNSVEEKTIQNNRLFNHTISYEMAYDINNNL